MSISIENPNQLVYGNLTKDLEVLLHKKNDFSEIAKHFMNFPFPTIEETALEINLINDLQNRAMKSSSWENYRKFMFGADGNINQYFEKELSRLGYEMPVEEVLQMQDELSTLIIILKNHYQRPRPFQVAFYTEQKCNPFPSISAQSPSYPSGHSVEAYFTAYYLSVLFPPAKDGLLKLAERISSSREVMGVHFQSDLSFGKTIAQALTKHNTIIEKYLTIKPKTTSEVLPPQNT